MLQVHVEAVGEAGSAVEVIPRVQVQQTARPVPVQHAAHALHDLTVVPNLVEVEAVDLGVLRQPRQAFDVIVVPAREPHLADRCAPRAVAERLVPRG